MKETIIALGITVMSFSIFPNDDFEDDKRYKRQVNITMTNDNGKTYVVQVNKATLMKNLKKAQNQKKHGFNSDINQKPMAGIKLTINKEGNTVMTKTISQNAMHGTQNTTFTTVIEYPTLFDQTPPI